MTGSRTQAPLLIVFIDLKLWVAQTRKLGDEKAAMIVDGYYEHVALQVALAGGTVVKFIGDGALATFPRSAVDAAIEMLPALKRQIDNYMAANGCECSLSARAHFGDVIAGDFGAKGAKHYDIIGNAVNDTVRLESHGVTVSAEAFEILHDAVRQHFTKHPTGAWVLIGQPNA